MKKLIAVDIDEVLSPFHEPFLRHHNERYGTNFTYPDPDRRYFLEQFTGEPSDIVEAKIYDFLHHAILQDMIRPLPSAYDALSAMKMAGYELVVVTARGPEYDEATTYFLNRNFPRIFSDVHKIPQYSGVALTPANGKIGICSELGATHLIDDNLGTATAAAEQGMCAVVFGDYHWNSAEVLPTGVSRCKNWSEVVEYFDGRDD